MQGFIGWDQSYDYANAFNTGDIVSVTLTVASSTSGSGTIRNLTTGKSYSQSFNVDSGNALCRGDVEWMVSIASSLLPDFSIITFTDMSATLSSGDTIGASDVTDLWEMIDAAGMVIAAAALRPDGSVTISYIEEWSEYPGTAE
jgi:hypothetical protein